jgi:trimeric autotransporter adhesin
MKKLSIILILLPFCVKAQTISTVAGNGASSHTGDGGQATSASLSGPISVAVDHSGNMYISDQSNSCIRKVDASGIISTYAGSLLASALGDGGPATDAKLFVPTGIATDASDNLYIADWGHNRIRKVTPAGIITTVAGNGTTTFSGDGGPATDASLNYPNYLTFDASGNMYISDFMAYRIRKVNTGGIISTVAGNGTTTYGGDGVQATSTGMESRPTGVAADNDGNVYFMSGSRVFKVSASGTITAIAGGGSAGYTGDGGPATNAEIGSSPKGLSFDGFGSLYIGDVSNYVIRAVNLWTGTISTVAGTGSGGFSGDGGSPGACTFAHPAGMNFDAVHNAYVPDFTNNRVRKITGLINSVENIGNTPEDVVIYPNPTTDQLTISTRSKIGDVTICNILGQVLYEHFFDGPVTTIDLAAYPAGLYLVGINGMNIRKIEKQ